MRDSNPQNNTELEVNKLRLVLKMKLISTTDEYHKLMLLFYLSWKINTECELDAIDQSGCTPLHHACINAPDGHRSVKVGVSIGH